MLEFLFKLQPNNYLSIVIFFMGAFLVFAAYTISKGNYKFSTICQNIYPNKFIEESVYQAKTKVYNLTCGIIFIVLSIGGQFLTEPWMFFLFLIFGCFFLLFFKGKVELELKNIVYEKREEKKAKKPATVVVSESTGVAIEEFVD